MSEITSQEWLLARPEIGLGTAERIAAENLPPKRLDILFQVCKNNRLVTLSPYGKAAHCVLQKLARLRDSGE